MKKLLCFGDSNTYGYDPRSYIGERYPADVRWTGLLGSSYTVVNAGQNGRGIPRRAAETSAVRDLLEQERPDVSLVMLGTNDLLQTPGITAADTAERMERFLRPLLDVPCGSRFLLIAPPPMVPGAWVTEARLLTDSAALSGAYRALAARLGTAFADAGAWQVSLAFDGVHFTEAGHHAFAAGLADVVRTWTP